MSVPKAHLVQQSNHIGRSLSVSVGTSESFTPRELERHLIRRLNRRGKTLRVKRHRAGNVIFAEKQVAEILRRIAHGCERVAELRLVHAEAERLLSLARANESNLRKRD